MIPNLPVYISLLFIVITFVTVYLVYRASNNSSALLTTLVVWLIIQGIAGMFGFYTVSNTIPPRFALLAPPAMLAIVILFILPNGRHFMDGFNLRTLTWIHTIRIFVEICLWFLYRNGDVPKQMTFEGGNFDIISGLSAPFMVYIAFVDSRVKRGFLLIWNFICLSLLLKIVITAVLSVPGAFQKFAFEQPDIAVLYFPFVWLPCCVVPIIFFAHVAAIRKLIIIGRVV